MALPIGWSQKEFDDWFVELSDEAWSSYDETFRTRSEPELQVNVEEWLATGATTSPLPRAWSMKEFTDLMADLQKEAEATYDQFILSRTPADVMGDTMARVAAHPPPLIVSFMGSLPANTTLTRASAGWTFGPSGVLTSFASNVPRFRYNPESLALEGLLVERQTINLNRNSSAGGAVPGTPGTQPTNWVVATTNNGVTRTIVGAGVDDGIPYLDIRYAGTPSATTSMTIRPEPVSTIAASQFQIWTASFYVKLQGGSTTNVQVREVVTARNSGGSSLGGISTIIAARGEPLRTQRYDANLTCPESTAWIDSDVRLDYTLDQPFDITLRIGLPQLVLGGLATSPVVTTTVALTREADIVTCAPPLPAGLWDVTVTRLSGSTVGRVDFTGGVSFTVPTSSSPLRTIKFQMV